MLDVNIITALHPASRFSVSLIPPNLPGKCIVCGSSGGDNRQFVDFGFDIDLWGTVYWCSVCLVEPVNHLGWINKEQWSALNETNEQLVTRIQQLEAENAILRDVRSSLSILDQYLSSGSNDSALDEIKQRIAGENYVSDGPSELSEGSDDSGSPEQVNESGHEDLSDSLGDKSEDGGTSDSDGFNFDL